MLEVFVPLYCQNELKWICSVILGEFLGLEYCVQQWGKASVCIKHADMRLEMPDVFFAKTATGWLQQSTLPSLPLIEWDPTDFALDVSLVRTRLPIIFGTPGVELSDNNAKLGIDVFGSAFFMLSRYEEAVNRNRDNHDRFPATASIAYQAGFLDRPIINEYVEILWAVMKYLWPGLKRKHRDARTLISCDLDLPFDTSGDSFKGLLRRMCGQLVRQHSVFSWPNLIRNYRVSARENYIFDLYRSAIDWIMQVNEREGNKVAFNFIPVQTVQKYDNNFNLNDLRMRELIRQIYAQGHEIGFHPGYNTYKHPDNFALSVDTLRRVMKEENVNQELLGGRQHYLRWDALTTSQLWDANGLTYDSSLSYADQSGFRCGTCYEYPMYDLLSRKSLNVRQRSLIVMEASVIASCYMGLGYSDAALELMQQYKRICKLYNGDFTLLWHNSHLINLKDKLFYQDLIRA